MNSFHTKRLPVERDHVAPDGSDVRVLLDLDKGGLAHFELGPGQTSVAVAHRTVEEIWYFMGGRGEMWRKLNGIEEVVPVDPGVCITIPVGTHFQFRSFGYEALSAICVTMPRYPGEGEAYEVDAKWDPTLKPGENNPRAIWVVAQNRYPPTSEDGVYNAQSIGIWYAKQAKWAIFNQDRHAKMSEGAAFNVRALRYEE